MSAILRPHHAAELAASAIHPDVIAERGYQTVMDPTDLLDKGFAPYQCRVPGLLLPSQNAAGENGRYQLKPDRPRIDPDSGKAIKYETPAGATMWLDVPGAALDARGNAKVDLWITEGLKKADAGVSAGLACIGLLGVWNWRVLHEWALFELKDRTVFIAFDSDLVDKKEVRQALTALAAFLTSLGAKVRIVRLPSGPNGKKVGLDDYLAAGHTAADVESLAGPVVRLPLLQEDDDEREVTRLSAALGQAQERMRLLLALDRNKEIKAQRATVRAVAWELESAYDGGRADEDGWVKVWLEDIAKNAGKTDESVGKDVEAMKRDGLLEKKKVPETFTKVDKGTGELQERTRSRLYLRCKNVNELLGRAAGWRPAPPPKKPNQGSWGGDRPCPKCGGTERKKVEICASCAHVFDREPQDAVYQPIGAPEAETPVSEAVPTLLQPQDAVYQPDEVDPPPDNWLDRSRDVLAAGRDPHDDGHDPPCRRCRDAPPLETSHLCAGCIASYADGGRLIPKG